MAYLVECYRPGVSEREVAATLDRFDRGDALRDRGLVGAGELAGFVKGQ
jgi:hypothetical protein